MLPQNCGIVAVELRRPKVYKIINFFSTRCSTLRAGRWFFNLHQLIYITCITWARFYWKFIRLAHRGGILWPKFDHSKTGAESGVNIWTGPLRLYAEDGQHKPSQRQRETWDFSAFLLCHERRQSPLSQRHWRRHVVDYQISLFGSTPALFTHPLWLIWLDTVIPAACNFKNPGSRSRTVDLVSVVCFCKCADSRLWVLVCSSNPGHKSGFCTCFVQLRTVIPWFLLKNTSLKPVFFFVERHANIHLLCWLAFANRIQNS